MVKIGERAIRECNEHIGIRLQREADTLSSTAPPPSATQAVKEVFQDGGMVETRKPIQTGSVGISDESGNAPYTLGETKLISGRVWHGPNDTVRRCEVGIQEKNESQHEYGWSTSGSIHERCGW